MIFYYNSSYVQQNQKRKIKPEVIIPSFYKRHWHIVPQLMQIKF